MTRIAINGFGRIGRLSLRAIHEQEREDMAVVMINDLGPVEANAHLLKYDSVYGAFPGENKIDGDQHLVDSVHKDLRRARAGAHSMIPTSTGAARSVGHVLPGLEGRLDGIAIRVPTPNVSLVDLKFTASRDTTVDEINDAMTDAENGRLKGILETNAAPLVSIDFNHNPHSAIFDLTQTRVVDHRTCRVLAWYDNEWAYACRMVDVAAILGDL
jgi:glyceraldehyde 3-phosphate dehydrogenase